MKKELDYNQMDLDIMDAIINYCKENDVSTVDANTIMSDYLNYSTDDVCAYIKYINEDKDVKKIIKETLIGISVNVDSIRSIILLETMFTGAIGTSYMLTGEKIYDKYSKKNRKILDTEFSIYEFFGSRIYIDKKESIDISDLKCKFTYNKSTGMIGIGITFKQDNINSILKIGFGDMVIFYTPNNDNIAISSLLLSFEVIKQLSK